MRTRQLQRRDENMNEAKNLLKRMRKQNKKYFDSKHFVTNEKINKNDFILFHDTQHENDRHQLQVKVQMTKIVSNQKNHSK
jgi:hypothetical protein